MPWEADCKDKVHSPIANALPILHAALHILELVYLETSGGCKWQACRTCMEHYV